MKVSPQEILKLLKTQDISTHVLQKIDFETSFKKAGVDSLDTSLLYFSIQEQYGFEISDAEVAMLDSIQDIVNWLNNRLDPA